MIRIIDPVIGRRFSGAAGVKSSDMETPRDDTSLPRGDTSLLEDDTSTTGDASCLNDGDTDHRRAALSYRIDDPETKRYEFGVCRNLCNAELESDHFTAFSACSDSDWGVCARSLFTFSQ